MSLQRVRARALARVPVEALEPVRALVVALVRVPVLARAVARLGWVALFL